MSHQKRAKTKGIPPDLTVRETVISRTGIVTSEQDKLVTDKPNCKMLGSDMLQNNQSWDAHLSSGSKAVLPAVRRQIGMLSRLRKHLTKKAMLLLVNSLALSKLSYTICPMGKHNKQPPQRGLRQPRTWQPDL